MNTTLLTVVLACVLLAATGCSTLRGYRADPKTASQWAGEYKFDLERSFEATFQLAKEDGRIPQGADRGSLEARKLRAMATLGEGRGTMHLTLEDDGTGRFDFDSPVQDLHHDGAWRIKNGTVVLLGDVSEITFIPLSETELSYGQQGVMHVLVRQ